MRTRWWMLAGIAAAGLLVSQPGWAHRYIPDDGTHGTFATAIPITDPDVSQVVYHEVKPGASEIWLTLGAEAGRDVTLQMGVPKIDRLKSFRPAFAVLGPGLPQVTLPFAIPEGYGGWVFTTDDVASPDVFHEDFTGTDSWQFPEQKVTLPTDGQYYVVAYAPSGDPGKLWLAVGKAESFTGPDILGLPNVVYQVRLFHEVGPIGGIASWVLLFLALFAVVLLVLLFMR